MDTIPSFQIDHNQLLRGVYVSRIDRIGAESVTTFDLRMKEPNREPVMNLAPMHTFEHLGATYLRNEPEWKDRIIYFGPMGCRTGFYLLLKGEPSSRDILPLLEGMFRFIAEFEDTIPGTEARDCGNHLDHNLPSARWEARKYLNEVLLAIKDENLSYPE